MPAKPIFTALFSALATIMNFFVRKSDKRSEILTIDIDLSMVILLPRSSFVYVETHTSLSLTSTISL